MKRLLILMVLPGFMAACNNNQNTAGNATLKDSLVTSDSLAHPLTRAYTESFEIGDPKYAQSVLDFYINYDRNAFEGSMDIFADSVRIGFSDGKEFIASGDSAMILIREMRKKFQQVKSIPDAYITVKFKYNLNFTWVAVWGKREVINNGDTTRTTINENWGFNEMGKLSNINFLAKKLLK